MIFSYKQNEIMKLNVDYYLLIDIRKSKAEVYCPYAIVFLKNKRGCLVVTGVADSL